MNKKTLISISWIFIILSIIYILLEYYGYIRYINLHLFSTENYIQTYNTLNKTKNKVVITLLVDDNDLNNIGPVINSLLDQTIKVNLISIILDQNNKWILPEDLKKCISLVKCTSCKPSNKPSSKPNNKQSDIDSLLTTLIREGENNTKIIILDCKKIYGKDFIESLIEKSEKYPNYIIYNNDKNYIDIKNGVLFDNSFFQSDFCNTNFKESGSSCNDFINNYFKNIPKLNINYNQNYKKI